MAAPTVPPVIKALTVRQPFAHAIITGEKRIEYRTWKTDYRGPLLIHVSSKVRLTRAEAARNPAADVYSVLLGSVTLERITGSEGEYQWHLRKPRPFTTPLPMVGALGLWTPHIVVRCDHCNAEQKVAPLVPSHRCVRCRRSFPVEW